MMDYISREAFRRRMYHEAFENDSDMQRWDSGCWIRYKLFENCIDAEPAADVRENRRGWWVRTGQSFLNPNIFRNFTCSECGCDIGQTKLNFCPNCGSYNGGKE